MNTDSDTRTFLKSMEDIEKYAQDIQNQTAAEWDFAAEGLKILYDHPEITGELREMCLLGIVSTIERAASLAEARHFVIKKKIEESCLALRNGTSKIVHCSNLAILRSTSTSHKFM